MSLELGAITLAALAEVIAGRVVGKGLDWGKERAGALWAWYRSGGQNSTDPLTVIRQIIPELDEPAARFVHSSLINVSIASGIASFQHTAFESGGRTSFETGADGRIDLQDRTTSTTPNSRVETGQGTRVTIQKSGGLHQNADGLSITSRPGGDPNATVFSISVPAGGDPNETAFAIKVHKK